MNMKKKKESELIVTERTGKRMEQQLRGGKCREDEALSERRGQKSGVGML